MVRHGRRPARTPGGFGADRRHAGPITGLAGAAPHRAKIRPLVHHATIGKPTHAVLAARTLPKLALAAALRAEHRRRICKRPRALWANQQYGKEDQPARPPHLFSRSQPSRPYTIKPNANISSEPEHTCTLCGLLDRLQ